MGYAAKIVTGETADTFKLQVYRGSFMGVDESGEAFGAKSLADATPNLIVESDDLTTLQELYDWAKNNRSMLANFVVSMTGAGATELNTLAQVLATGGTTQYLSGTEYADVLESIAELDVTFFLCTNLNAAEGKGVEASTNGKLFTFLKQDAKFTEFMVVPGGEDDTDLFGDANSSQSIAKFFNSGQVVCVHGLLS